MSTTLLYRAAAVLLVLFAIGHQLGFRHVDPAWHADEVVRAMRTTHFTVQGFSRDYWGFFSGFGFFVTTLLLFSAVIAWQLGGVSAATLDSLRLVRWAFAAAYVVIALETWTYFFTAPGVFATLIALCLVVAAASSRGTSTTEATIQHYFDALARREGGSRRSPTTSSSRATRVPTSRSSERPPISPRQSASTPALPACRCATGSWRATAPAC